MSVCVYGLSSYAISWILVEVSMRARVYVWVCVYARFCGYNLINTTVCRSSKTKDEHEKKNVVEICTQSSTNGSE